MDIKEDLPHSYNQEASLIMKESSEEKIMIKKRMISDGLHHKEYHSLLDM